MRVLQYIIDAISSYILDNTENNTFNLWISNVVALAWFKTFILFGNLLRSSVPADYSRITSFRYQVFCHWVDTFSYVFLVPEGIIRPVVNVSPLIWFIRYIY
jgi:hypothetical protein